MMLDNLQINNSLLQNHNQIFVQFSIPHFLSQKQRKSNRSINWIELSEKWKKNTIQKDFIVWKNRENARK